MDSLVSTEWLEDHAAGLVILDASRHLPDAARDARAEFVAAHIPGARFFDTSAPAAGFGAQIAAMGLSPDQPIVVYDNSALHSAARGWFLLHLHGFARVAVLDGGLPGPLAPTWQSRWGSLTAALMAALFALVSLATRSRPGR